MGEGQGEVVPTSPQSEIRNLKSEITLISLARLLRPFGITSRVMRIGPTIAKGYDLSDFTHAFARFLN